MWHHCIVYTRTEAWIYQWLDLVWLGSFTKPPLNSTWWMQLNLKTWQKDICFQFHNSKCYSSFYSIRCLFNVKPICMSSRPYFSIFIFNIHITKKSCTCLVAIFWPGIVLTDQLKPKITLFWNNRRFDTYCSSFRQITNYMIWYGGDISYRYYWLVKSEKCRYCSFLGQFCRHVSLLLLLVISKDHHHQWGEA